VGRGRRKSCSTGWLEECRGSSQRSNICVLAAEFPFARDRFLFHSSARMKKALITGITGQDGSYLADLLLEKGYEVHGIIRRASTFNTSRIDHLYKDPHVNGVRMFLHYGDLADALNLTRLIDRTGPDEIYHLG